MIRMYRNWNSKKYKTTILCNFFKCNYSNFNSRNSRLQTFFKKGALKNVANFTGKHLFWRLLLTNLQATDLQL